MKIKIYALNVKERLNESVDKYLKLFSSERKEKIMRYKFLPDRNRTVFAELLARKLISDLTGKIDVKIFRDSDGRPYTEESGIYFSLSHSSEWILCSIGNVINGIDVEILNHKGINSEIAKRFFLPSEYESIKNLSDWRRKFFHYWTLKESCLKCMNLKDWRNVDCEKLLNGNDLIGGKNFEIDELTVAGCCTYRENLPESIEILKLKNGDDENVDSIFGAFRDGKSKN